jgi:type III restriction enzyme
MLNDNRLLVIEYKGEYLAETPDTKEKANIGGIWARLSKGKALFLIATIKKGGKSLEQQIKEKIEEHT